MKTGLRLALTLAFTASFAAARPLTTEEKACVFETPLSFGASITAETAMTIPGYHTALAARALARGIFFLPQFGISPTHLLVSSYAKKWPFQLGTNISKMFTQSDDDLGSEQVRTLLSGTNRAAFDAASIVMSVDAFYWDAIYDNCGYGQNVGVEPIITTLIQATHSQGKTLILGNVPHESPKTVLIDSESLGIPGLWYNPKPSCVSSINETLKRECTVDKGCYLIDIDSMVKTLDGGGTLNVEGTPYSLYWIRPDGVHLSMYGSLYLFHQIIDALEANPPSCTPKNKS